MPENHSAVLDSSNDPRQLTEAAATLAHSQSREDHLELLKHLQSEAFLLRLDSAEACRGSPKALNIRLVLEELSRGQPQPGHGTLVALTRSEAFLSEPARVDLLITACIPIRPAPTELIKFWDAHCLPQDGYDNLTIEALVNNGSAPAIGLLTDKLKDARFEDEEKINWMRSSIMTQRNDAILLGACEELVQRGLSESLRLALAEALFDYKPYDWFTPATVLHPPSRATLSPEARVIRERIGNFVMANLKPSESLAAVIKTELEALRQGGNSP